MTEYSCIWPSRDLVITRELRWMLMMRREMKNRVQVYQSRGPRSMDWEPGPIVRGKNCVVVAEGARGRGFNGSRRARVETEQTFTEGGWERRESVLARGARLVGAWIEKNSTGTAHDSACKTAAEHDRLVSPVKAYTKSALNAQSHTQESARCPCKIFSSFELVPARGRPDLRGGVRRACGKISVLDEKQAMSFKSGLSK
ncbi:hypothetical protein EDB85DRAFT_2211669 [Lactarius pseudohatsudake]|nr:hypothetical protein EDB85DRAFT_2211669 [Lactarius pseudohatsudake]